MGVRWVSRRNEICGSVRGYRVGQRWVARCAEPFLGEECNELRGILVFVTELRLALHS